MTKHLDLGEVITAIITPFMPDAEQTVDLDGLELLANRLLREGTDTLLLTGSTGEAAQLSSDEKWGILDRIRRYTPKGTKIMVSTGDTNTQRAIAKTKKAFDMGADAVLISVPEYIKPPQSSLFIHFNAVAKAVPGKPIMIYNIPGRTGMEILPETVAKLAKENPNIIGIKQSMGNLDKVSELKMLCPNGFQIYSGDDSLTLPMLALGAKGVVSVASHLEGRLIKNMIQDFKCGKVANAASIHQLLFPLYKALFMTTNPMPIKEALYQRQLIDSPTLRTLGEMPEDEKTKLNQILWQFEKQKYIFQKHLKNQQAGAGRE